MNDAEIEDRPGEIPVEAPRPGIRLGDILYVLFRHKWKIILVACAAAAVAAALPFVTPRIYQSEAKLFIRYVLESKSPGQMGANDSRIKSPDERGENVINTELEILTSLDLAQQVVDIIGPDKILGKGGGTNRNDAATVLRKNLLAEVPKKSNVIRVVFQHSDPEIVQPVLNQLIESYLKKHAEIHRSVGVFDEFLTQETDQLRSRLVQTEDELRKIKAQAGVTSVEDTKKLYTEQMAKVQQDILSAEAELAERQAAAAEMAKLLPAKPATPAASAPTNSVASTNDVAVPPGKLAEYRRATGLLGALRTKEQEFLLEYTPSNSMVISIQEQLAIQQQVKQQLEEQYPGLLLVKVAETRAASVESPAPNTRNELAAELAKATALQSKLKILTEQLDKIRKASTVVYDAEGPITELQRKKELEEAHYKYFAESLEQSRIDEALGAGRVSNISKIQAPSPPYRAASKLLKMMAGVLFGGLAGAFGLAFVTEFFLDQSLRRPSEVQTRLQLPLFISIPLLNGNGHKRLSARKSLALLPETTEPGAQKPANGSQLSTLNSQLTGTAPSALPLVGSADSALRTPHSTLPLAPFYDALRDRLITYFEIKGLTHKPKLVALTSCGEGAGVSTIAAGLAASLSETGDGNVLLVDMNLEHGAAHPFYRGKLSCGLDDALALEKRGNAQVQENLYVVQESTNGDKLPRVLPRRFTHLLPKLKASDYDYIIFDMPPISQVSVTPRLSRFMDVILTVVESERTDRQLVQDATGLLVEGGADVGIVLNKRRQYVPRALHQEL